MLVAGFIAIALFCIFSAVAQAIYAGLAFCGYYLKYAFVPSFRAEQIAIKRRKLEAERIRQERFAKYGNSDLVQYGEEGCAGLGCSGCHCNWCGFDRPPCY